MHKKIYLYEMFMKTENIRSGMGRDGKNQRPRLRGACERSTPERGWPLAHHARWLALGELLLPPVVPKINIRPPRGWECRLQTHIPQTT